MAKIDPIPIDVTFDVTPEMLRLLRVQKLWLARQKTDEAEGLLHLLDHIMDEFADGPFTQEDVFGVLEPDVVEPEKVPTLYRITLTVIDSDLGDDHEPLTWVESDTNYPWLRGKTTTTEQRFEMMGAPTTPYEIRFNEMEYRLSWEEYVMTHCFYCNVRLIDDEQLRCPHCATSVTDMVVAKATTLAFKRYDFGPDIVDKSGSHGLLMDTNDGHREWFEPRAALKNWSLEI